MQVRLEDYSIGRCNGVFVEPGGQRVVRSLEPFHFRPALVCFCEAETLPHPLQPIQRLVQRAAQLQRRAQSPLEYTPGYLAARVAEPVLKRHNQPAVKERLRCIVARRQPVRRKQQTRERRELERVAVFDLCRDAVASRDGLECFWQVPVAHFGILIRPTLSY